jgi:hypothetical protein
VLARKSSPCLMRLYKGNTTRNTEAAALDNRRLGPAIVRGACLGLHHLAAHALMESAIFA